ncbi:RagB/SusD family nutrient uptake outer membrane protein [Weeksellaceae bacterium TAE3-ERU29]|nr:RagB/SusD family nutrient uptake outer membrane protein [Weeksellaceae bacterium TAE3-ERU29]
MKINKYLTSILFAGTLFTGCSDDFLDVEGKNILTKEQVTSSPIATNGVIDGIFASFRSFGIGGVSSHVDYGHKGVISALDIMGEDIAMYKFHWMGYFYNYLGRTTTNSRSKILWNTYYTQAGQANSIILSIDDSDNASKNLLGQAYFYRAFSYFNLARIFGPTYVGHENDKSIPIYLDDSKEGNPRSTNKEVYEVILSDLKKAKSLLNGYQRNTKEKVNEDVVTYLLANVYLEMGDYQLAAQSADELIGKYNLMDETEWLSGFSNISNTECIWGADITSETSTSYASFFSHFDNGGSGYAGALAVYKLMNKRLYEKISDTDYRKKAFADASSDVPYKSLKFKDPGGFEGDYIYMRISEMYFVSAEAKARLNNGDAAQVLYNIVSKRDPNYQMSQNTGNDLIEEIITQKRIEMWGEGVHWFDLKRLKKGITRDYDGTNHLESARLNLSMDSPSFLFQIPEDEINSNNNINAGDQNPN